MRINENTKRNIGESIKTISAGVALVLTLGSVVVSIFTFITARELSPVARGLEIVTKGLAANDERDAIDHPNFVTRDELKEKIEAIEKRQDDIFNRVDFLYKRELTRD